MCLPTDFATKEDRKLFSCFLVSLAWQGVVIILYMVWYIFQRRIAHHNYAADIEVFDEEGRRSSGVVTPGGAVSRTSGGESITSRTGLASSAPSVNTCRASKVTSNRQVRPFAMNAMNVTRCSIEPRGSFRQLDF